jgi:hypothetical protein
LNEEFEGGKLNFLKVRARREEEEEELEEE